MGLEDISNEQKDIMYQSFVDQIQLMDGDPYLKLPDKKSFFEEYNPTKRPSFWKRLYHTLF